jgi:hypothetical protein
MNGKLVVVIIACLIAVCAGGVAAQIGLGSIEGYVKDEQGAVIIGARIVLTGDMLMRTRVTASGSRGAYRLINLPPGFYTINISKENYQTKEITNLQVRAGKTSSYNITLPVGEFAETVTIVQEAPIIDLKNPERRINIDGAFLDRLPLSTTREWTSALSLVPSLVMSGEFTGGSLRSSFTGVSVHGAGLSENVFNLDGASIQTDPSYDPVLFTSAIIEDIEVVTSGYDASVTSGLGGYVNIVTKSGGNDFSGAFQLIMQPEDWNWENDENGQTPKSELYMPEVSIGGPILKDRVWFFGSMLYDHRDQGIYRDENTLHWLEHNGAEPSDYNYNNERRNARFFGKVSAALSETDKLVATFNWDRTENLFGLYYALAEARSLDKTGGPFFSLDYTKTFSDDLLISLQGSYREAQTGSFPASGDLEDIATEIYRYGEVIRSGGRIRYGDHDTMTRMGGVGIARDRFEKHSEFRGNANLFVEDLWGQHDTKMGVYYLPERKYQHNYAFAEPYTEFDQAMDNDGNWVTFQAIRRGQGNYKGRADHYVNANAAGYFQDSWTLNDRMTVNFGFRVEKNFDKVEIFRQTAISPNIGVSYALTRDQKHALRISYSRKSELLSNSNLAATYSSSGSAGSTYYYDYDLDGVWDRISDYPSTLVINENTSKNLVDGFDPVEVDDDLGPSHGDFFQVGYSTVLPWKITFDAAFVYNIYSDTVTKYDYYYALWENNEPVALRDPSRPSLQLWKNNEWSSTHYRGLEFSLSRAFYDGWQLMASYAWQTTTEKGEWSPYDPEYYYFPQDWFEYTDATNDPRHVVRLAASYVGPYGIMFNGNIVHRSSLPCEAYRHMEGEGMNIPYYIELSGQVVTHPLARMNNWAQARSAERRARRIHRCRDGREPGHRQGV